MEFFEQLRGYIPEEEVLGKMADFFAVFSDITRIKLLSALSVCELCVSDLSAALRLNQTTVSHQLKQLRDSGIVSSKRDGKQIVYGIKNKKVYEIMLVGAENVSRTQSAD